MKNLIYLIFVIVLTIVLYEYFRNDLKPMLNPLFNWAFDIINNIKI